MGCRQRRIEHGLMNIGFSLLKMKGIRGGNRDGQYIRNEQYGKE